MIGGARHEGAAAAVGIASSPARPVPRLPFAAALLLCLGALPAAMAQPVRLDALLVDAETGAPLPGATVQVEGEATGDAADADGRAVLPLPGLPATVVARFVGYAPAVLTLGAGDARDGVVRRTIRLSVAPFVLGEVAVSAEPPGETIWRRVLARRARLAQSIGAYSAETYARLLLLRDARLDVRPTPIRISEALTNLTWTAQTGGREEVAARRRRPEGGPFRWADQGPTLDVYFETELAFDGRPVPSPTHPRALDYYEFRLGETVERDGLRFLDLAVIPRRGGLPSGRVRVVDTLWVVAEAELRADPVALGPTADLWEVTHRWTYGPVWSGPALRDSVWLPTRYEREGAVDAGIPGFNVPPVRFRQRSEVTRHAVGYRGAVPPMRRRLLAPAAVYGGAEVYADARRALPLDSLEAHADSAAWLAGRDLASLLPPEGLTVAFGVPLVSRALRISVEGKDD